MKKMLKTSISCIAIFVLIVIPLNYLSQITERKESAVKYQDFFKDNEDYDVLFLGSSHMIDGVSPMDMWYESGLTSYNLGGHSNTVPTSYWVFMNALDYTIPKIVVVDGYMIGSPYKISSDNYSSVHTSLDAFPFSITKLKGVLDLLNDPQLEPGIEKGEVVINEKRVPLGLLWNFSVYHSRWSEVTESDFHLQESWNKGAEDRINVFPMEFHETDKVDNIDSVGVKYLNLIVSECKERGIGVLLVYLPAKDGYQTQANWMSEYAYEHDLDFINFTNNNYINPSTDFSDAAGHLNPSGAKKISAFIGDYIKENWMLDGNYNVWVQDYEEYVFYKTALLKQQNHISNYLMLLNDCSYTVKIECSKQFFQKYQELINNISTLGSCSTVITETNADKTTAMIETLYNNQMVDKVVITDEVLNRK